MTAQHVGEAGMLGSVERFFESPWDDVVLTQTLKGTKDMRRRQSFSWNQLLRASVSLW